MHGASPGSQRFGMTFFVAVLLLGAWFGAVEGAITVPTFGAKTSSATTDFRPTLYTVPTTAFIGRVDKGVDNDIDDDCFYLRFGSSTAGALAVGDFGIGGGITATSCSIGAFLTVADSPVLTDLDEDGALTDFASVLNYLEVDGKQGFSDGDMVYVDQTTTTTGAICSAQGADNTLGFCDLRLKAQTIGSALAYGSMVRAGAGDFVEASDTDGVLPDTAALSAVSDVSLHYFDANQNRLMDAGDTLYLRIGAGTPGTQFHNAGYGAFVPFTMDLRLSAYGALAAGTMVTAGAADHVPTLEAPFGAKVLRIGSTPLTDKLLLHFSAGTTRVQMGDVALNTVTGQTAGVVATSDTTGVGLTGTESAAAFEDMVFAVDLTGNGLDATDGWYLDRRAEFGGDGATKTLSIFDVRLKAVMFGGVTYAAGSVVAAADEDYKGFSGSGHAAAFKLKWFDADRAQSLMTLRALTNAKITGADSTIDPPETAYIEADATVDGTSIRLIPISFTSGSTVAAGNADVNTGGGALMPLVDLRISGGDGTFAAGECAYISADNTVSAGDIRIINCGSVLAGTVAAETDVGGVLTETANPDYVTGPDPTFSAGDFVYIDGDATTNSATAVDFLRVTPISYAPNSLALCPSSGVKDVDCSVSLTALTNAKVTGADGAWTFPTEAVYVSADHAVSIGDKRVTTIVFNSFTALPITDVVAGDADLPGSDVGPGDGLYLSPTALTGATSASIIPLLNDVRLMQPLFAFGSVVTTGNSDFTPRYLSLVSTNSAQPGSSFRWDRGVSGTFTDDTFFLRPGTDTTTVTPLAGDVRLLPSLTLVAGTMFSSGNDDGSATLVRDTTDGGALATICYVSVGSLFSGYDSGDYVYLDTAFFTGSGANVLSQNDVRMTATNGGAAGTMVNTADADRTTYTTCTGHASNGLQGGRSWMIKFLDQDHDGTFDAGGSDNQRIEHLLLSAEQTDGSGDPCNAEATRCSVIMRLGDIPLTGSLTGTTPPTTTTTTTTTTAPAPPGTATVTSTTTPATTSDAETTSSTGPSTPLTIAQINQALEDGLKVTRSDGINTLTWPIQTGITGYQVWSSDSPFVLLATLSADTVTYQHAGEATTKYVVTAYLGTPLTVEQFNAGEIPGYTEAPEGEKAGSPKRGLIPAPGLVFAIAAVAFALALVRRRLA